LRFGETVEDGLIPGSIIIVFSTDGNGVVGIKEPLDGVSELKWIKTVPVVVEFKISNPGKVLTVASGKMTSGTVGSCRKEPGVESIGKGFVESNVILSGEQRTLSTLKTN
jgi:hypothetical protein